ncbi:MAG: hypothetical protein AAFU69_08945, partial [Pseudomonadota bacterium]
QIINAGKYAGQQVIPPFLACALLINFIVNNKETAVFEYGGLDKAQRHDLTAQYVRYIFFRKARDQVHDGILPHLFSCYKTFGRASIEFRSISVSFPELGTQSKSNSP